MSEQREVTPEELKVNALLERLAQLENDKADLRVEATIMHINNERFIERIKELESEVSKEEDEGSDDKN